MNLWQRIMHPSGGLGYHRLALQHRFKLWIPFIQDLNRWLGNWQPPEKNLLWIGPSAAWCIDLSFFSRFEQVTAAEPDPIARMLLSARWVSKFGQKGPRLHFLKSVDLFFEGEFASGLKKYLQDAPQTAILFSNVLGQLHLIGNQFPEKFPDWEKSLENALAPETHWASFHDRLSGPFWVESILLTREASKNVPNQILIQHLGALQPKSKEIEVQDHFTENLFTSGTRRKFFEWRLTPHTTHLIEAVSSKVPTP